MKKKIIIARLTDISNLLLLNSNFIDNLGILNGKMGVALFFFKYSRHTKRKIYENCAGEIIDEIYESLDKRIPITFSNGLMGIGWGIEYLVKNKYVEANTNEILSNLDNDIFNKSIATSFFNDDFFGCGHYFLSRLSNEESFDELSYLKKKQIHIFLIDEIEKNIMNKRYTEFNIQPLKIEMLNSLIWYLIEVNKLGLYSNKIKEIGTYLLDHIAFINRSKESMVDQFVLNLLEKELVDIIQVQNDKSFRNLKSNCFSYLKHIDRSNDLFSNICYYNVYNPIVR